MATIHKQEFRIRDLSTRSVILFPSRYVGLSLLISIGTIRTPYVERADERNKTEPRLSETSKKSFSSQERTKSLSMDLHPPSMSTPSKSKEQVQPPSQMFPLTCYQIGMSTRTFTHPRTLKMTTATTKMRKTSRRRPRQ